METTNTIWKLIHNDTNECVFSGNSVYDLLEWYHQNHFNSFYNYGSKEYTIYNANDNKNYFL